MSGTTTTKTIEFILPAYLAALGLASLLCPANNWDVIGYTAAVKAYRIDDPIKLHEQVFAELRATLPAPTFQALTTDENPTDPAHYRAAVFQDPQVLAEQVPFYRIRPGYLALLAGLAWVGLSVATATHVVSAVSVALGLYLLARLLPPRGAPGTCVARLAFIPASLLFGAAQLARVSTPDSLAFLGIALVAYFFLTERGAAALCVAPLLVSVRTDLVLLAVPFAVLVGWRLLPHRGWAIASGLGAVAVYALIGVLWPGAGYGTTFRATLVEQTAHPLSHRVFLTWAEYVRTLLHGAQGALREGGFLACAALTVALAGRLLDRSRADAAPPFRRPETVLAATMLLYVLLHFLLFPVLWSRFFAAPYLVILVLLVRVWDERPDRIRGGGGS